MSKRAIVFVGVLSFILFPPVPAMAQANPEVRAFADQLGKCMVASTNGRDRIAVAGWMLAGIASAPQLKDVATVSPQRKDELDRGMAALFTRLMTKDCNNEARALLATRDTAAYEAAGAPLGMIAVRELMSDPTTLSALSAYVKYIREEDLAALRP